MVELIIFDLGRVLVEFNFRKVINRLKPYTSKTEDQIHRYFQHTPLWDAFERGRIAPRPFFQSLKKDLALQGLSFEAFTPIWNKIFEEKPDTIAIVRRLRGHYPLALLSNSNILHWEYLMKRHRFMHWFDYSVASYAVGLRKPEPEIYRTVLERAGVSPQEAIFIDDILEHVQAARALGLRAHQFRGARRLSTQLNGILP
jgi:putative hydrolase of the HAD superfamily